MKNKRLWLGIIICIVLFLLAVKLRKHVVISKRSAPIVSFVKEWKKMGKPVVVQEIKLKDVATYTKVTSWKVNENVFEGHVSKKVRDQLRIGQEMIFEVDGSVFTGKIAKVSNDISLETGMFPVFVELPQKSEVNGWIVANAHTGTIANVININDEVAEYEKGRYFVWVIENGFAKRKEITITSRNSYGLIVKDGLKVGEFIVVEGHTKLEEGDKVKILAQKERGYKS